MKTAIIAASSFLFATTASGVVLANMNTVNLLIAGVTYDYGSGSEIAANMENFDVTEEAKKAGLKDDEYGFDNMLSADGQWMQIIEEVTIGGSSTGSSGGGINLLWLLQNGKDADKSSYAYQLLEVYAKNEQGVYNNNKYHVSPEAILGSHYNETRLGSFPVPNPTGFAGGKIASGVHLEDTTKAHAAGGGGSVYKDVNSDGPDGPFQIEIFSSGKSEHASKKRGDGKYDAYAFVDSLNFVDSKYNVIAEKMVAATGTKPDMRVVAALFALDHNRGESGAGWMTFGLPYSNTGGIKGSNYLKNSTVASMTGEQLKAHYYYPTKMLNWFDKYNIPVEKVIGKTRGLAPLLVVANGGFLDMPLKQQTLNAINGLPEDVIHKVYPGKSTSEVIAILNASVKKPWDYMGMSKSAFDKIYGTGAISDNYEALYQLKSGGYNNLFWTDKSIQSDNYKAGTNTLIGSLEGIAAAYMLDTAAMGTYVMLKVAQTAGIESLLDGTVIDPTNPSNLYQGTQGTGGSTELITKKVVKWVRVNTATAQPMTVTAEVAKPVSYNPAAAGVDGNFAQFLGELNLYGKLTKSQLGAIETVYDIAGGPYGQTNPRRGSTTKDGRRVTDCSLWASYSFFMDNSKDVGWTTAGIKNSAIPLVSTKQTKPYRGTVWNAKAVQITKTGKSMAPSKKFDYGQAMEDWQWVDVMKTGDMANGNSGSGHIWIYLTKNTTNKNFVIPLEVSKSAPDHSTYKPGQHISYESSGFLLKRGNKMGLQPKGKPYSFDSTTKAYVAFRPTYHPQY